MRLPMMLFLLSLCVLTGILLDPAWQTGWATVDVPLLFLMYLAQLDRKDRLYILGGALALSRGLLGVENLLTAFLPILVAIESQVLLRHWFHVRDPWVRVIVMAPFFALVIIVKWFAAALVQSHLFKTWATLGPTLAWGVLYAVLASVLFFPILDCLRPYMRSYRHPL